MHHSSPTLDATGHNTHGAALGINLLASQFAHQLVLEAAYVGASGSRNFRNTAGDQFGLGMRYQKPISHNLLIRTDHMIAWRSSDTDLRGSRVELRWKF